MTPVDRQLLARWRSQGDAEAFQQLAQRYAGIVFAACVRILGNAAAAEDATQECFERLAMVRREPQGRLGAWLHRVAVNRALDQRKGDRRRAHRELQYAMTQPAGVEPVWDDVYAFVDEALARLPERFHTPLTAHFLEGRSHAEIAKLLGISRQTVTYRIGKGLEAVRKDLRKKGIAVSTLSLAGLLEHNLAHAAAVTASLTAQLGKLAMAGPGTGTAGACFWQGFLGAVLAKPAAQGVAVLVVAAAGLLLWLPSMEGNGRANAGAEAQNVNVADADADSGGKRDASEQVAEPGPPADAQTASEPVGEQEEGTAKPEGPSSIHGVVYGPDGSPAANATVEIHYIKPRPSETGWTLDHPVWTTQTDEQGKFAQTGLPLKYHVVRTYTDTLCSIDPMYLDPWILVNRDMQIVLKQRRSVSGRVVDAGGLPVAGARVQPEHVLSGHYVQNKAASRDLPAVTDGEGRFRFDYLWQDSWSFEVAARGYPNTTKEAAPPGHQDLVITLPAGGRIAGRVTARNSSEPLEGVRVKVLPKDRPRRTSLFRVADTTDADGQYRIHGLPGGAYVMEVRHDVYAAAQSPLEVRVADGASKTAFDLELAEGGTIAGRVYYEGLEEPIADAEVMAAPFRDFRAKTGPTGAYRISGLPEGPASAWLWSWPREYGPAMMQEGPSKDVVIRAGETAAGIDLTLPRPIHITGRVLDSKGQGIAHASVHANVRETQSSYVLTEPDGAFTLTLWRPSDEVRIMAHKRGFARGFAEPFMLGTEGRTGLELRLAPQSILSGVVVDAHGRPMPGERLLASWSEYRPFGLPHAVSGPDGQFRFTELFAGEYRIDWSTLSRGGGKFAGPKLEVADPAPIPLGKGEHLDGLRVVLKPPAGLVISGRITDTFGQPIAGANISAQSTDKEVRGRASSAHTYTADEGTYTIEGLAQCSYELWIAALGYTSPPLREMEVAAGTRNADFQLDATGSIEGRVLDAATRQPIGGAQVSARGDRIHMIGYKQSNVSSNRATGRYYVQNAPVGRVSVSAIAPGYARSRIQRVMVETGKAYKGIDLLLTPAARVEGRVVTAGGSPVAKAAIFLDSVPGPYDKEQETIATTDSDGRFVLDSLAPNRQRHVFAVYPGYAAAHALVAPGGKRPQEPELVLTPGGTIEGVVLFDGTPLAGQYASCERGGVREHDAARGNRSRRPLFARACAARRAGGARAAPGYGNLRSAAAHPRTNRVCARRPNGQCRHGFRLALGCTFWSGVPQRATGRGKS